MTWEAVEWTTACLAWRFHRQVRRGSAEEPRAADQQAPRRLQQGVISFSAMAMWFDDCPCTLSRRLQAGLKISVESKVCFISIHSCLELP